MKAVCPRMVVVITGMALMGAGRAAAGTHTWTGAVSADWPAGGNWAGGPPVAGGDVVVPAGTTFAPAIPAGTNPVSGVYSSFTVASGATVTCLGDPTAVNEPSGGTAAKPHGIGVTIFTVNATIDGTLSAFGQGFRNNQGPGNVGGGASHGGKGNGAPWGTTYGSLTQPTALGTGGDGAATPARVGGGAIRLVVEETLSLGGTIDASAPNTDWSGSGGSIWLTMSNFTGSGVIKAEGGKSTPVAGSAGGGRVALVYTHSTFSGYVSVAGGAGKDAATRAGEAGTLWEPKRFDGMAGTPESPATMLITNSYQYYFPDAGVTNHWNLNVSNAWFETHQGSLAIPNLHVHNGVFGFDRYAENRKHETDMNYLEITNRIRVTGNATANLIAKTYTLPGGVTVGFGSVLGIRGNTNAVNPESGGTTGNPHGTGVTIISPTVTIDGTLSGVGGGFGHGKGPGCGFDGSAHGGKGGTVGSSTYGSLTRPTALGSGGAAGSASREGGGAIRLVVGGTLDVNGAIDVSAPSNDRAGSGGSIWLTVSNLTGRGVIKAEGGGPTVHPFLGGGGRIAIDYTNSTFTGLLSLAGGKLGTTFIGQPGTLWEPKMFAGKTGDPQAPQAILITNSFQYHFPDATLTNYWNLTVSNAWFEPHQGPLQLSDLLLTNALFRFDRYAHGEPTVPDTSFFEIANDLRVTGVSKLYLPPRTYAIGGSFCVGPTENAIVYALGDTGAVNPSSGGTGAQPHGEGVTLRCAGATIDGWVNADALGFPPKKGPGSPGMSVGGGGHGGQGGAVGGTYGVLTRPTALGSGGATELRYGGGAIRLIADGTVTVNGKVSAKANDSNAYTGSGGSIWITAGTLAGSGVLLASGGNNSSAYYTGGGGRIALCASRHDFTGSVSVAPGTVSGATPGKTGTLFRCTSPVPDCGAAEREGPQLTTGFAVGGNAVYITRTVTRWDRSFAWNDESRDPDGNAVNNSADYVLSGLPPAVTYDVFTNGALAVAKADSGVTGTLSLTGVPLTPGATVLVQRVPAGTLILIR